MQLFANTANSSSVLSKTKSTFTGTSSKDVQISADRGLLLKKYSTLTEELIVSWTLSFVVWTLLPLNASLAIAVSLSSIADTGTVEDVLLPVKCGLSQGKSKLKKSMLKGKGNESLGLFVFPIRLSKRRDALSLSVLAFVLMCI
jgi:hypothetical protein